MEHLKQSRRYIVSHSEAWPQSLTYQNDPVHLGLYGQSMPHTTEDKMFLFDQISRANPLSVGLIYSKKQNALVDPFFCTFLATYLQIPCHLFEVVSDDTKNVKKALYTPLKNQEPSSLQKMPSELSDSKHFQIIYGKKQILNQDKVKLWIKKVYGIKSLT